jgi:hypothetical protein
MRNSTPKHYWLRLLPVVTLLFSFSQKKHFAKNSSSNIKVVFINTVNQNKIELNDSLYTNPFGEKYTVTKLKYYVTNVSLQNEQNYIDETASYYLIDESSPSSQAFTFSVRPGKYSALRFLLGVDSLHNVSGAQTGDLDPANDMFWTWNSGYVMAKMEGNSPASKLVNHKFEFHIGGFSGPFNVLREIKLAFPDKTIGFDAGKKYTIFIVADIDTWWQNPHNIKIAEHANITSPGEMAKEVSDNYSHMFHIKKIVSE